MKPSRLLRSSPLCAALAAGMGVVAATTRARAAPWLGADGEAMTLTQDILVGAILIGTVLFLSAAAFIFLRASNAARLSERRYAEDSAALKRQLDLAQSVMTAEPQVLIVCDRGEAPRLVTHSLNPASGVPAKIRLLLRFASWLEREAALDFERRIKDLQENATAFSLIAKTLNGATIEAEGRTTGNGYYVKIRDLAERRLELVNLTAQIRALEDELASKNALFDALPIPVWFRNADNRITWVNRTYIGMVDAARMEDVIEHQIELLETQQRKLVDTEIAKGEVFRKRLQTVIGGGRRTFEIVAVPFGQGSAGAAIDVAPLESAHDKLSRHIAAHDRVLDRVTTAVAIFGPDQKLAFYNEAYADFWRLDRAWLDGKPSLGEILDTLRQMRQIPEQADYRKWREQQLKAHESAEPREEEWHLPDGRSVFVIADQRPDGGTTLLYEDVTERLALESRYNALIHVQRETLDNLREGIAVFGSDGRLKLFNPAFVSIWGVDAGMISGQPHIDDIAMACKPRAGEDDPWLLARQAVTSVNETRQTFQGQHSFADGRVVAYAGVPLPDGGTLLAYIDITDSKRVELALIEKNEALEAADKLKNAFISHISRELRTPLTNIIGFSELLASPRTGLLNAKQREYLNDIRSSSVALLTIINDILDLTVIDAGALELNLMPVDVREVIDDAELGVRERLAKHNLKLDVEVDAGVDAIIADRQRLTQILFNLLSNAISFSEDGSVITLSCRRDGGNISFTVQDMGCGIPEEYQKTVFDRFESRPHGSKHRGAGLGLSLVKSLAEMHGGDVLLRSAPGAGTTVTVLIPEGGPRRLARDAANQPQQPSAAAEHRRSDGANSATVAR